MNCLAGQPCQDGWVAAPRGISCIMSLHAGAACGFRALGGQRALRSAEFVREIQGGIILWHSEW
jgi:hypothetical protein